MSKSEKPQVFISYAHDDLEKVEKLYNDLKSRDVNVWMDKVDLQPGPWKRQIEKQIPKCRYFLFCISQASLKKAAEGNGFVEEELQHAYNIADKQDLKSFTILPVRFEDVGHGDNRLSIHQQYDLFENWEKEIDRLATILEGRVLNESDIEKTLSAEEQLIEGVMNKAYVARVTEKYADAYGLFNAVTLIDPKHSEAWHHKGWSLFRLGRYEESIQAYDEALRLKNDNFLTWNNRGFAFTRLGKFEEALSSYEKAIRLNPDEARPWWNTGYALAGLGRYEEAVEAYNKAIQRKSDDALTWSNKGYALSKLNRYEEAIEAYNKAILLPLEEYNTAIQRKSGDALTWGNKGYALSKLNRYEEAIEAYNKAILIMPNHALTWNNLADAFLRLARLDEALEASIKAIEIESIHGSFWHTKGEILAAMDRHDDAIIAFTRAKDLGFED